MSPSPTQFLVDADLPVVAEMDLAVDYYQSIWTPLYVPSIKMKTYRAKNSV